MAHKYSFALRSKEDGSEFVYDTIADSEDEAYEQLSMVYDCVQVLSMDIFEL